MAFITIETIWMDRIFLYLANLNALILLIILSFQLYRAKTSKQKSSRKIADNTQQTRILNAFALAVPIFTVLYTTQRAISTQGIGNCRLHIIWAGLLWTTTKFMMYLFFIARLDVAFRSSSFQFSNKVFIFLYILVILAWLTSNIQYAIWGNSIKLTSEQFNITYCKSISPLFTLMYFAFCDFTISIALTILFVRRLFEAFYIKQKEQQNRQQLNKVIKTIARYVTLSMVGVSTTILSLLMFGLTGWFMPIAVDFIINNHCIFLMYQANVKYFHCICGPLHSLIGKCFRFCMGDDEYGPDVIKVYDITHSQNRSTYDSSCTGTSLGRETSPNLQSQTETTSNPELALETQISLGNTQK